MRVLIVGAGPTGALVADLLSKRATNLPIAISIWEKSRGCGGRMATSRLNDNGAKVDMGAQYISSTSKYQIQHKQFYADLLSASVLQSLSSEGIHGQKGTDPSTQHYMCPSGLSSIAKHYIKQSGATLHLGKHIEKISQTGTEVTAQAQDGFVDKFDCVVITIPVPQILSLGGVTEMMEEEKINVLRDVSYSSRFALGIKLPDDFEPPVGWTASYITDNSCVRFVCIDSKKRNQGKPHTLLVHTGVPYGIKHLEISKEDMVEDMMDNLEMVLPWLPNRKDLIIKPHKWRYSQVHKAVPNEPGFMTISMSPSIVLSGDAFTHSNLDGCMSSALKTTEELLQHFKVADSNL